MGLGGEIALAVVVAVLCSSSQLEAQLEVGFYDTTTCPQAELIVLTEVTKALVGNVGLAAGLVRMHFHDCFVRGCDGSVLIDSTPTNTAEKDSSINTSLRGFEVIYSAKAQLEAIPACKGVVSCADILAFAARDSIELSGGLSYEVPAGRRDGRVSLASETFNNLPGPNFNVDRLTQIFKVKGLAQDQMVTLSGAHTIGRSHCSSFSNRLYDFNSSVKQDPSLDAKYAARLKQQCPQGSTNTNLVVPMDPRSPNIVDASYYNNILVNRGLFTSDQTLLSEAATASLVRQNAAGSLLWQEKFAAAMVAMGQIGVLTGSNGEIHLNCRAIN